MIMAMGMKAAGDHPVGWRVAAAFCGALTLAAVFLWCYPRMAHLESPWDCTL